MHTHTQILYINWLYIYMLLINLVDLVFLHFLRASDSDVFSFESWFCHLIDHRQGSVFSSWKGTISTSSGWCED